MARTRQQHRRSRPKRLRTKRRHRQQLHHHNGHNGKIWFQRGGNTKTAKRFSSVSKMSDSKIFKQLNCSAGTKKRSSGGVSCFSPAELNRLKAMWNVRHPDSKITSSSPQNIWKHLRENYSRVCDKESCWVKQLAGNAHVEKELLSKFAPKSPKEWQKNPNEWLSSLDIISVMNQFEKAYPHFEFLGPSPIDFDKRLHDGKCVWTELCSFSLNNFVKDGTTKIGIIFNTDPHYKSGSHWICMFIDVPKKLIYFCDSTGDEPPKEINDFAARIQEQGRAMSPPLNMRYEYNTRAHQRSNTECGMYCLYIIINMLEGKLNAGDIKSKRISDDFIEEYRKIYFNPEL